jgi:predicted Zn-dependent protease
MSYHPGRRIYRREMTRRDFLWLASLAAAAPALPALSGCATDPVTGRSTLVGLSERDEVELDRKAAPKQFSADYGAVQDEALNAYVNSVERTLGSRSHRPAMPYSARVVNANYINAYTFPGGSMAATRGILLEMQNEDELAALLGHETGHVNARHAAEQAGKTMVSQAAVGIAGLAAAATGYGDAVPLVNLAGQVGASALLASYSRDDEREADALGMEYMSRAGYNPDGMVRLMEMLRGESKEQPGLLQTMFSTHPMSDERYATARREAEGRYAGQRGKPLARERYMDSTARLRALKPAIEEQQKAETLMAKKDLPQAEGHLANALRLAPDDYAGLVIMSKCQIAQKRYPDADRYLSRAVQVYPAEGQAQYLAGLSKLALKQPEQALARFEAYDRLLPGNANTLFFKGVAYESMQNNRAAGEQYARYVRSGAQNQQAQYAAKRLQEWGMAK